MISEVQINDEIKGLFESILFPEKPEKLYAPLRYMLELGGKRLRPKLCLMTYSLFRDGFSEEILEPAAALEIFHSFTLIHDDIMDKSRLRRGKPTVWTKWGEDTAILSGDVMCIDSYKRIAKAPKEVLHEALELFSKTASQVCDGQQYDMDFEMKAEISMDEYVNMIGLKTGVLLACSAKLGALIGGASSDDCENLYNYGYYLGLAFQVADDYLDVYGDERVFGKPIGGDIVNNKKSWLTTRAMEKAGPQDKKELSDAMILSADSPDQHKDKIERVKSIYARLGIEEDAKYEILRLNGKAMDYASKAANGIKYETLKRFAEKLVGRSV